MEKLTNQELALLGTLMAIEISKNKSISEIKVIKYLLTQVIATISTLICRE